MDQSETLLLFFAETNERQSCSRVPQSSWSLSSTCAEELWVDIDEIGQVTWDEKEVKHGQNLKYQKKRVRVSGSIKLLLRLKWSSAIGNAVCV